MHPSDPAFARPDGPVWEPQTGISARLYVATHLMSAMVAKYGPIYAGEGASLILDLADKLILEEGTR